MQLRALIKTRKRKWAMIVLGVVVCAAAVWLLLEVGHKPTDEEKYRRMIRKRDWGTWFYYRRSNHNLQGYLDRALRKLELSSFEESHKLAEELIRSGYLVAFPFTNRNYNAYERSAFIGTTNYWDCYMMSHEWSFIVCSNDAPRIRAALEKKP